MLQLNASFFSSRLFKSSLWLMLGLLLGFSIDYSNGRSFGMGIAFVLTGPEKYLVLAVSFGACLFFNRKKKRKSFHDGMFFRHDVKALASLLIMGFFSYCHLLPSTVRNTVFGWGMTDLLSVYPTEADILKKTLIEKKPDPAEALPNANATPLHLTGARWQSQIDIQRVAYATHCKALVIHSLVHGRNNHTVAVFMDGVDEATTKKVLAEDIWKWYDRPLFSTRTHGLILEWQDITHP